MNEMMQWNGLAWLLWLWWVMSVSYMIYATWWRNNVARESAVNERDLNAWATELAVKEAELETKIELWNQVDEQPEPTKNYHI